MPSRRLVEWVRRKKQYRNGRKMREMLPLWKLREGAMSSVWPVGEVRLKCLYRNGTEMREMLPLWKGDEGAMSPGRK